LRNKYFGLKDIKEITPYEKHDIAKKAQVEEMFDNIAHRYDFLNHLLSMGIDKLWRKSAVRILKQQQPKTVLDIATGTADFAIEDYNAAPEKIIGVDIAEQMLAIGREKIKAKGLSEKITLQRGDSENLPFDDNSFDAITVGFGVRNFENLEKGLKEMHRVLKPNGIAIVLEFSKPRVFPVKQAFYVYFHYVCPMIGKWFSKDPRAYTYLPESVDSFPEGNDFIEKLNEAGFQNTQCKPLTFGISSIYTGYKK
jgi:demethylmenaquinone methyltransferase / 2-methoxy-6-polyprenyl-1,4-benzoquinol methylase